MSSSTRAFVFVLAIAALVDRVAAAEPRIGTLEMNPSKTLIEFRLPGALHTTHGKFKLERGDIRADPRTGFAEGSIVVDASSGDSGIEARDNRMKDSVLEIQKYPKIVFTPSHVTGQLANDGRFLASLQGILTIHGSGHQIAIEVQGRLVGDTLIASAHFSVPYVDWGMRDPSVWLLTVAKQVDIEIATEGRVTWLHGKKAASIVQSR